MPAQTPPPPPSQPHNHRHLYLLSQPATTPVQPPQPPPEPPDETEPDEKMPAATASRHSSAHRAPHAARDGTETRTVRCAAYSRYSSLLQADSFSIAAQHHAMEQEAQARIASGERLEVTWFDEPEQSAHVETIGERPIFSRMIGEAEAGRFDLVMVHKMDRFSRRLKVTTEAMERLQRAHVGLYSVYERFDLTNPAGWLTAHLFAVLADFYSRNLGAEIKKGKDARARAGLHTCRVPFGYRRTGEKSAAEPDETEDDGTRHGGDWAGLHELFRLARAGLPDLEIAQALNRDGRWHLQGPSQVAASGEPRLWTRQNVQEVRRNVYYRPFAPGDDRGTILHAGVEYRGLHRAACTWDEWHDLQEMARSRRRGWLGSQADALGIPHTAEFRRLAVCAECGGALYVVRSVHYPHTDRQTVYERYVCLAEDRAVAPCPSNKTWARVEDVRAAWTDWLTDHLQLPDDAEQVIRRYAAEMKRLERRGVGGDGSSGTGAGATIERADVPREMKRWRQARANALAASLDGLIPHAEARKRIAEADTRLSELAALRDAGRGGAGGNDTAEQMEARVRDLHAFWRAHADLAATWREALTERRIQLATMLLEPGGLVLRLRGVRGQPGPQAAEIVEVRLRGVYEVLRQVAAFARAEAV